jgi:hypothetical protein
MNNIGQAVPIGPTAMLLGVCYLVQREMEFLIHPSAGSRPGPRRFPEPA